MSFQEGDPVAANRTWWNVLHGKTFNPIAFAVKKSRIARWGKTGDWNTQNREKREAGRTLFTY